MNAFVRESHGTGTEEKSPARSVGCAVFAAPPTSSSNQHLSGLFQNMLLLPYGLFLSSSADGGSVADAGCGERSFKRVSMLVRFMVRT